MTTRIPHYVTINDLHTATGFPEWTHNPQFQIFSTAKPYATLVPFMPPYTQAFYQIGFSTDLAGTSFSLQTERVEQRQNLFYVVAPGQVLSWSLGQPTNGFILYMSVDFLPFYLQPPDVAFPFLSLAKTTTMMVSDDLAADLLTDLQIIRQTYAQPGAYQHERLQGLALAFLYRCRACHEQFNQQQRRLPTAQRLTERFRQLVNQHFLDHLNVAQYADRLNVTPNYLSTVVRQNTGQSAKSIIDQRLLLEARNLLAYTTADVSEIAWQLGFEEVTHFGRFFRRETGQSPGAFRAKSA